MAVNAVIIMYFQSSQVGVKIAKYREGTNPAKVIL